jgi:hypothetical protein
LPSSPLDRREIAFAELLAVGFVGLIAIAANKTHMSLLLFPELAALAHDVFTRPRGKWASQPVRLILTPTLTGIVGLLVTRYSHYGVLQVLTITVLSLVIIRLLRSSIGPAFSAGVLPLVLDERRWLYPLAIFIGLASLTITLLIWQRWCSRKNSTPESVTEVSIDDALESNALGRLWLVHLLAFVAVLASVGQITGLRFILFPPLVVMAYEVLGHPELPGWIKRPALFPLVCFLTAAVGLGSFEILGKGALSIVVTVAVSIFLLRLFQARMPPALAIGLLPYVIQSPNWGFPVSVLIGTATLSLWFVVRARSQRTPGSVLVHQSH